MKFKKYLRLFLLLLAICNLPFLVLWIHHRLVTGLNPFIGSVFLLIVLLILLPVLIEGIKWAKTNWFDDNKREPVILFAVGLVSWIIFLIMSVDSSVDIHLYDTLYIISSWQVLLSVSILFGIFCLVYYLLTTVFKHNLHISLSRIHFWITYWSIFFIFWTAHVDRTNFVPLEGAGAPRRYVDYSGWASYQYDHHFNRYIIVAVILTLVAQLLFLFNIFYSLLPARHRSI